MVRQVHRHRDLGNGVLPALTSVKYNNGVAETANADFIERDAAVVVAALNVLHLAALAAIYAARRACLVYNQSAQVRQCREKALPNPSRDVFTSRVFEPVNLIQMMMVKLLM